MSAPATAATTRPLLIALDVDGTILHHDGHLTERVRDAVRAAAAAGHHVVIATGRAILSALTVVDQLGMRGDIRHIVCSNGAITIDVDPDGDPVADRDGPFDLSHQAEPTGFTLRDTVTFDPAPALTLLREEWPGAHIAVEDVGVGFLVNERFPDGELQGRQTVAPWEDLIASPVTRVTFRAPGSTSEDFLELVDRIGLHEVGYAVGYSAWLDLSPEGVSKASALEQLRRQLGVEPADTVAVGDQRNDLEMLGWAALGVAMGQAPPEVVAAADTTTGSVEDDGLAPVLERLAVPVTD